MKFFVLLHNQIMMAQSTILNSPEKWFNIEINEVEHQLKIIVMNCRDNGNLTEYQFNKLIALIEGISMNDFSE